MPIAEETFEDVNGSEAEEDEHFTTNCSNQPQVLVRTRSAPNLTAFAQSYSESKKVYDDLKMSGVNSYYSAEIFRGLGSSRSSKSSRNKDGKHKDESLADEAKATPYVAMAENNKEKRLFRQERALKAAIHHSLSYISEPSSSEDNASLSTRSVKKTEKARNARIRRLQALNQNVVASQLADDGEAPHASCMRNNLLDRMKAQYHAAAAASAAQSDSESETSNGELTGPVQSYQYHAATIAASNTPSRSVKSSTGTVSSFGSGGSFMIDLLDVQLAELNRPDGELKGPDEESL